MKQCPVCGCSNNDDAEICKKCGQNISNNRDIFDAYDSVKDKVKTLFGSRAKSDWSGNEEVSNTVKGNSDNIIAPDETVKATIGVSYIQNFMSGAGFKNGAAILTDKRLYYFGKGFSSIGKGMNTTTEEGIVSVDEITFTRFVHGSPLSLLVSAIVSLMLAMILFVSSFGSTDNSAGFMGFMILVFLVIGAVFLVAYQAGKSTVLEIAFPGGKYAFDARWHSTVNMREFQRQIHVVKDSLKAGHDNGKNEEAEDPQ